jgi:hypothetical protein
MVGEGLGKGDWKVGEAGSDRFRNSPRIMARATVSIISMSGPNQLRTLLRMRFICPSRPS